MFEAMLETLAERDRQHNCPGTSLYGRHKTGPSETEALGRPRGSFTIKPHAHSDAKGRKPISTSTQSLQSNY